MSKQTETTQNKNIILKTLDRPSWNDFPVGTKVHGINGGYHVRVLTGWKWYGSGTVFPRPSADWRSIELPFTQGDVEQSVKDLFDEPMVQGLVNCKHEANEKLCDDVIRKQCKHCLGWC